MSWYIELEQPQLAFGKNYIVTSVVLKNNNFLNSQPNRIVYELHTNTSKCKFPTPSWAKVHVHLHVLHNHRPCNMTNLCGSEILYDNNDTE